jgi:hypothetical protein
MATFASLRALHALIGDALDDVERIFVSYQPSVHSPTGSESSGSAQYSLSPRVSEDENEQSSSRLSVARRTVRPAVTSRGAAFSPHRRACN